MEPRKRPGNVYRSKEIIKALYGLPYNMPENTTSQPFEENTRPRQTSRQTSRQTPRPVVSTYGISKYIIPNGRL
jgi:hypothetical protein